MKTYLLIIIAFLLFATTAYSQDVQKYNTVDLLVKDLLEKTKVAGISVSVSKSEELIYSKAFGYADVSNKISMEPSSQIRAASVSKVITATALGKLATDGKLDFDKPLKEYLPSLFEPYASLTTRQLAGHTAGVQHRPSKNVKNKHYTDVNETLSFFEDQPLLFNPDTGYKYSTLGYNLLAILIEKISGKPYLDYMRDDIFKPLKMTQTFADDQFQISEKNAKLYYLKKGKLTLDKKVQDGSYKLAGAGFRSTSVDLVQMMNAYSNGFISEEVVRDMFTSNSLTNGDVTNVGIGWRINKDITGNYTIEHAGSWQGARTVIVYYPESELAISMMINTKCELFIEESAHIIAQYFLNDDNKSIQLENLDKKLEVIDNRTSGSNEKYEGELNFSNSTEGILLIKTEREWLKKNKVYHLPSKNNYALSTSYGLLYLKLDPNFEGQLFQYQSINDSYHMNKRPVLYLKERR